VRKAGFKRNAQNGWASCPFTQAAFLRLSSNPSFTRDAIIPAKAEMLLDMSLAHPDHQFWPDEISLRDALAPLRRNFVGHRQITDPYLIGLTIFRQGKLATLDTALSSMLPSSGMRQTFIEQL
jgi:predicted nucleic acid-binding protein